MDRGTKLSIGVTIVLIGIPTAAGFYPPIFAGLAASLPLDLIFAWMLRAGILTLGFLIGWFVRGIRESDPGTEVNSENHGVSVASDREEQPTVDTIIGCVDVDEVVWRGIAEVSDVKVENVDVSRTPRCPKCQKEMTRESYQLPTGRRTSPLRSQKTVTRKLWECPDDDCGHSIQRESGQHSEAEQLFRGFVQDIVESEGAEYSLDILIERVDGEVTPQGVWEAYSTVVDNTHVSTDCFR